MATNGIIHDSTKILIKILLELLPQVIGTICGTTPCVGIGNHRAPCKESCHALSCSTYSITGNKLQLEERLTVVVDCRSAPQLSIGIEQFGITLLYNLKGCFLCQVKIILITRTTVEVCCNIGAIVRS